MSLTSRCALIGLTLILAGPILARTVSDQDRPTLLAPRSAASRADLDRREALRLYGLGLFHEKNNRLVESLKTFEEAQRLDPNSAAISRGLFSLYLALDRIDDALKIGRRVMRIDPDDYQTAYIVGRQFRGLDKGKEAIEAMLHASRAKSLHDRPDLEAQVWIDIAALQEKAEQYGPAEKALLRVVALLDRPAAIMEAGKFTRAEVDQQCAEVLERLGRVCMKARAISRAIDAFEKAKTKDNLRAPRLSFHLAGVYKEQGKPREALAQVETYLRSQPASVDGYELRIRLQEQLGRQGDVLPDLEASSGRDPNNLALRLLLGREYRKAGKLREGRELYNALLKIHVTPEVYRGLFDLDKDEGARGAERILTLLDAAVTGGSGDDKQPGEAADARRARAMLAVLRDDAAMVRAILDVTVRPGRLDKLSLMTKGMLATLASRTNQLPAAEELFRSCLDQPGGPGQQEAEVYVGLIRVLRLQYKHAAILDTCKKGLAEAQQTSRVLFHTEALKSHQMLGNHKAALAAADAAVNDAGKQILLCKRLRVDALVQAGKHDRALAECQAMLKEYNSGGDLRDVRAVLSSVYQAMGKFDECERQLELVLEADPSDATANNDLGYIWADRNKKLVEAERLIRKAIDLDRHQRTTGTAISADADRDNAAYVDSLGWVLFRQGKLAAAAGELEKASKLPGGDNDPVVWDHLGDVYLRLKQRDRALGVWKKALALYKAGARRKGDPRFKEIQDKIRLVTP